MNNKEIFIKCPECETVNRAFGKGKYINCVICGNKLNVKGNSNSKGGKTVWIVLVVLIIALVLPVLLFIKTNFSGNERVLYDNAQIVYSYTLDYCINARLNKTPLDDGFYIICLQNREGTPQFTGEKDDLDLYYSAYYNQDYQQYFGVSIKQGLPYAAYWSIEPLDETVLQGDSAGKHGNVGIYPAAYER